MTQLIMALIMAQIEEVLLLQSRVFKNQEN